MAYFNGLLVPQSVLSVGQRIESDLMLNGRMSTSLLFPAVPRDGVVVTVPSDEVAVRVFGAIYLVPGSELAIFTRDCLSEIDPKPSSEQKLVAASVLGLIGQFISSRNRPANVDNIRKMMRTWQGAAEFLHVGSPVEELFDFATFAEILVRTNWKSFDTSAWRGNRMMQFMDSELE